MYIVPIAWIYVTLMAAVAEATNANGTVIGAIVTFVLYGVLPVSLVMYVLGTPGRKRKIRARETYERELAADSGAAPGLGDSVDAPDASSHAATDTVAPVREKT
jgi:hypothetical protein